jgi:hypothetical protein
MSSGGDKSFLAANVKKYLFLRRLVLNIKTGKRILKVYLIDTILAFHNSYHCKYLMGDIKQITAKWSKYF